MPTKLVRSRNITDQAAELMLFNDYIPSHFLASLGLVCAPYTTFFIAQPTASYRASLSTTKRMPRE